MQISSIQLLLELQQIRLTLTYTLQTTPGLYRQLKSDVRSPPIRQDLSPRHGYARALRGPGRIRGHIGGPRRGAGLC